ncbi:hypothetical protein B5V02_06345 [Mesorhizobium kowhaii]|uniref:Uncharacterized protein n=1 Tax=Mesorhizobium kowhaii TaxID=1300272 RepID=A0A2W7CBC6_9HYPH|nr:hypothetical protein B5V02_06345 [Mesorhizobium kowhaii]
MPYIIYGKNRLKTGAAFLAMALLILFCIFLAAISYLDISYLLYVEYATFILSMIHIYNFMNKSE